MSPIPLALYSASSLNHSDSRELIESSHIGLVSRFLDSISALQVVRLHNGDGSKSAQIRPVLSHQQGAGLIKLVISLGMRERWEVQHEKLRTRASWVHSFERVNEDVAEMQEQ